MPADHLTVFIVDDDRAVRDSLGLMLGLAGYPVALFNDAEAFLAASRPEWSGCLVADLRLPGASGIELQAALRARGSPLPVIIITAHGDVPTARAAFLADAVDFLEKPFKQGQLMDAIESAFAREAQRHARANPGSAPDPLAELTPREREVLEHAVLGKHAKEIAAALGISPRTVEVHKARVMAKLGARNVMELVRVVLEARRPGTES
jgi:FixJ family two-component response regulator